MSVVIHLTNKNYITIESTNDIDGVWRQIKAGESIETGRWDDKVLVNPDNVTTLTVGR